MSTKKNRDEYRLPGYFLPKRPWRNRTTISGLECRMAWREYAEPFKRALGATTCRWDSRVGVLEFFRVGRTTILPIPEAERLRSTIQEAWWTEDLFNAQHMRTVEADRLWSKAHKKPLVTPDLGSLIEWLMSPKGQAYVRKNRGKK